MPDSDPRTAGAQTAADTRYVVTFVHGTFAREAAWVKEGSALRRALAPLGNVHFDVFRWTGHNNHNARLAAGHELAAHLDTLAEQHPNAKRVVIAHSHGGNVALYAGRHVKNPQSLQHLVCLATPFLYCAAMRNPLRLLLGVGAASVAMGALAYMIGWAFLRSYMGWPEVDENKDILDYLLGTPLQLAVLAATILATFAVVSGYCSRVMDQRVERLGWQPLPQTNVLSTVYRFDEAERLLYLTDMLATRPSRFVWSIVEIIALVTLIGIGLMSLGALALMLMPESSALHGALVRWGAPSARGWMDLLGRFVFSFAAMFVFLAPLALLLPLVRGNPWAYGWERPSLALMLDVAPINRPRGLAARAIEHYEIPIGAFGKGKWMAHTVIYDDKRIQDRLLYWISGTPLPTPGGKIAINAEAQLSSSNAWAAPWRDSRALVVLALPLMIALGFVVGHPTANGDVLIDLEPLQYLLAAVLGAWAGFAGVIVVGIAALLKCVRYAGEFSVSGWPQLRVAHRGSFGEAGALLAVAILFAQMHRLRLTLRADTLPLRHYLMLTATAVLAVGTHDGFGTRLWADANAWLVLIAFLIGLSAVPLGSLAAGLLLLTSISMFAGLAGLATDGNLRPGVMPNDLPAFLPLVTPMRALNFALVALLGRGMRQRMWAGAAAEPVNRGGNLLTTPWALAFWALACLVAWCFTFRMVLGVRAGDTVRGLVPLHPMFTHVIALVGFATGALHGRRAAVALLAAYLAIGVGLPLALVLLVAVPGNPVQSMLLPLHFGRMPPGVVLKLEYVLGNLLLGAGLVLPLAALLGAAVARHAAELQPRWQMSAARVRAADAAALEADEIRADPQQVLPSLAFRVLDILVPLALVALIVWGIVQKTSS